MADDEELEGDALLLAEHEDVALDLIDLPPAKDDDHDVRDLGCCGAVNVVAALWKKCSVLFYRCRVGRASSLSFQLDCLSPRFFLGSLGTG